MAMHAAARSHLLQLPAPQAREPFGPQPDSAGISPRRTESVSHRKEKELEVEFSETQR